MFSKWQARKLGVWVVIYMNKHTLARTTIGTSPHVHPLVGTEVVKQIKTQQNIESIFEKLQWHSLGDADVSARTSNEGE